MKNRAKSFISIFLLIGVTFSLFFFLPIFIGDPIADQLIYHPPEGSRKWGYFHYIPESALQRDTVRTVLYLHTGFQNASSDDLVNFVKWFQLPPIQRECYLNGYALLCVVTPRGFGEYPVFKLYSQAMVQWTMFTNEFDIPAYDFYKRPDLEFIKAFEDFCTFLTGHGKAAYPKLFVTGFSAGGTATNRFAFLHPNLVAAAAIGGSGLYIFPNSTWDVLELTYPLGIADISSISDTSYDENLLKTVPHFLFLGENDVNEQNDPAAFEDSLNSTHIALVASNFGAQQVERTQYYHNNLTQWGFQSTLKIYAGTGHTYTAAMRADTFDFFNNVM